MARGAENWNRRDKIRAGAVSGPWRSVPRDPQVVEVPPARPAPPTATRDAEGDLRAPSLGKAESVLLLGEPVKPPLLLIAGAGPVAVAQPAGASDESAPPGPPARSPSKAAQYSVLGAVLLGSLIAGAIIALAFLLRFAEEKPTQAVTPRPGAVVALND